jgi:hypothetical protein
MMDQQTAAQIAVQVMMGVSLAACAGLRAWLPMMAVGLMGRMGLIALNPTFSFLESTPALVVFGVATLLELLGDKVIAVDHALDVVGTFVRPLAGTLLVAAALSKTDPMVALVAGLVVGGGTALTVHSGKAAARTQSTSLALFHGGVGNAALSLIEDGLSVMGSVLAVLLPVLAFVLALGLLAASLVFIYLFWRAGRKLWRLLAGVPPAR